MKRLNFLLIAMAFIFVTACGNDQDTNNADAYIETEEDQQAYDIYRQNCITCHAVDLSGNMDPAKSNLQKVGDRLTKAEIEETIRKGKGTIMQGFENRLSDDDINLLATWLAARK